MRSPRLLSAPANSRALLLLIPGLLLGLATAHCGAADNPKSDPPGETGGETELDAEADADPDATPGDATPGDATPDTAPTVTCIKSPSYAAPLRINHNPDSLRRVANAGMVLLGDGRIMVALLEAVDTGSRHALWARIVEPTTGAYTPDERLDVDADALTDSSAFQIFAISGGNGAVGVRFGDGHLKVYSKGKWSPDLAASMPIAGGDELGYIAGASGQVLVTRARGTAPFGQAIVYRPDEGGVKGSWSALQTLDLDGASGKPRIDRALLSDDRFLTLMWQGGGGPAVRTRSLSGSWGTATGKAEIGAADASPQYQLLGDNSIVLIGLEGGGDTRRVVTSTWNATDNWSTARLLSKPTADTNGVVPASIGTSLYRVSDLETEFVAWVAGCAGVAKDCEFTAVTRRYSAGAWKDPVDLGIGTKRTGADGASVVSLDGGTPLVIRYTPDRTNAELRVRTSGGTFTPTMTLVKDSPLFASNTNIDARFYGTAENLWTLVRRDSVSDGGPTTTLAMALGRLDPTAGSATWSLVTAGSFELRTFAGFFPYADGAGGFSVGAAAATNGTEAAPIIAHSNAPGGMTEAASVISSDEASASFVSVPRNAPRPGRDRAALYVVSAKPTDPGSRLRAYAYNGVSGASPKVLANETRAPRTFGDGTLIFGCGGAILYAADPVDGSHTLELVIVRESGSAPADAG